MAGYVLTTVEVDMVMSSLITIAFSVLVNLLMDQIIKRIDMVESLKSVE